jgi:SOS-response transcriptional repressor LexA
MKPYVNCVPQYDLSVAAGDFKDFFGSPIERWIELPPPYRNSENYFICKVVGESMNKVIPNNSYCLFEKYSGGTREGKIVLAQHSSIQDAEFGSGLTVKFYHSEKEVTDELWRHKTILLKPSSDDKNFKNLELEEDALKEFKVLGIFVKVLS